MKIVVFNFGQTGSTGQIALDLLSGFERRGHETMGVFFGNILGLNNKNFRYLKISEASHFFAKLKARIFDDDGFSYRSKTKALLKEIDSFAPDWFILNIMHGVWIDTESVLSYASCHGIKIALFAHDQWWMTGRCACVMDCKKYIDGCGNCPHRRWYPKTFFLDKSRRRWKLKGELLERTFAIAIAPSEWMVGNLKKSRITESLKCYALGNPIDPVLFSLAPNRTNVFAGPNQKVVGFCAGNWNEWKGLSYVKRLCLDLDKLGIATVVIGMDSPCDGLPQNTRIVPRTNDKTLLHKFYSGFDCLVNPTLNDTFSMTNCEALATGTPVVVFKTGGAYEMIVEGENGYVVPQRDYDRLLTTTLNVLERVFDRARVRQTIEPLFVDRYVERVLDVLENAKDDDK